MQKSASLTTIILTLICPPLSLLITFGCDCNFFLNIFLLPFPLLAHGHAFAVQYSHFKHRHEMDRFIEASRRRRYAQRARNESRSLNDDYDNARGSEERDKLGVEKKNKGVDSNKENGGKGTVEAKGGGGTERAYHVVTKGDVEDFVRRSGLGEYKSPMVETVVDGE